MAATSFSAMGTTITSLLPAVIAADAAHLIADLFARWERALSRFQPESDLSRLNRRSGGMAVVSPLLFDVLATALAAADATNGIYDPTLLPQLQQVGYDRTFTEVPAQQPAMRSPAMPGGGWRAIWLDTANRYIALPPEVQIDLGGIAKGMAVDAALDRLREHGIASALVNAGGDLGVIGIPPELDHWPVAVPTGAVLRLERGALATSGMTRRQWHQGAQLRHHLIDPRTGISAASDIQLATVAANRCVQAEVAAKVAFILGAEAGLAFLRQHNMPGILLRADGTHCSTGGL